MPRVEIYLKDWCGYCTMARQLLSRKGVQAEEIEISGNPERTREMQDRSGRNTVPQIFINGQSIGGFDNLARLEREGLLDRLLAPAE